MKNKDFRNINNYIDNINDMLISLRNYVEHLEYERDYLKDYSSRLEMDLAVERGQISPERCTKT